jgi:cell division septal protein FtsQ
MLTRPPVVPERKQRYWRRQANRRVRKARLTRTMLRWSLVLLANGVVAGLLLSAGWRIYRQATSTRELALEIIEVDGTRRSSADAIRQRLDPHLGRNLLDLNLHEVIADAMGDPWVLEVSARRLLPHTVRITVTEREPRAFAMIQGVAHVVDATGFVVGPAGMSLPDDLPVLTGLEHLEGDELVAALRRGSRMIGQLEVAAEPWLEELSEIDLSRHDRIVVRTVAPGPAIFLDPEQVTRNVASYVELRRNISRRVGAIEYVDLRWRDRISIMPVTPFRASRS